MGFFKSSKPAAPEKTAAPKAPQTLGECATAGLLVEVICQSCYRRKLVDPRLFIPKYTAEYRVPNLSGKLKCAICNSLRCVAAIAPPGAKEVRLE